MKTKLLSLIVLFFLDPLHAKDIAYIISDQSFGNGYAAKNVEALQKIGYQTDFSEAPTLAAINEKLKHYETSLTAEDKFIFSLNCHGRVSQNLQNEEMQQHHCCLTPNCSEKFQPAQLDAFIKASKAKIAIIEDACGSGSSVMTLAQKHPGICVIASTGPTSLAFYGTTHLYRYYEKSKDLTSIIFQGQLDRIAQSQNEIARTSARINYTQCLDENIATFRQNYLDFSENLGDWELHQAIIFKEIYPTSNYPEETSLENLFKVSSERTAIIEKKFSEVNSSLNLEITNPRFKQIFDQEFPILAQSYKNKNINYSFELIVSPSALENLISKTFSEGLRLHKKLEEEIKKLNDLLKSPSRPAEDKIEPHRQKIQNFHKEVRKNQMHMSLLLNIYEEIKCKMNTSPCSEFKL